MEGPEKTPTLFSARFTHSTPVLAVMPVLSNRRFFGLTCLLSLTNYSSDVPIVLWPITRLSPTLSDQSTVSTLVFQKALLFRLDDTQRTFTKVEIHGISIPWLPLSNYTMPCISGTSKDILPSPQPLYPFLKTSVLPLLLELMHPRRRPTRLCTMQ